MLDMDYIKKNGLVYSEDMRTLVAVDSESHDFTGRVPFGVHFIEDEIFSGCLFENISLPDSVEQLGVCLFENSKRLYKVKLPANIKELPPYLFSGCTALQNVAMPTVLKAFPEGLFYGCSSLMEIPFRAGIKELPECVFAGCSSIQSLVIPETVEVIASQAAANCTDLVTVVLPASLKELADDAFAGCKSLRNIRISEDNNLFYVNEEDGCLYERTAGEDKCKIKIAEIEPQNVSFYKENVDEENDSFYSDEGLDEYDDTFSSEVTGDELESVAPEILTGDDMIADTEDKASNGFGHDISISPEELAAIESKMTVVSPVHEEPKNEVQAETNDFENHVDNMLADIMNEEKVRSNSVQSDISVGEKETQVLSDMMDVMNDKKASENYGKISEEELENLFASNEKSEADNSVADNNIDAKTQILIDSVRLSKIIECIPASEALTEPDLFVIAEVTITNENGEESFTEKLEKCCKKFAQIQDLKRIVLLAGLPVENDEFMQFYYHFISYKNVIFACEAASPSKMSDYAKAVCKQSGIDLTKEILLEQRKKIGIKNDSLIKLVIQDLK